MRFHERCGKLLYNPLFRDEENIYLDIASRVYPVYNNDLATIQKYEMLGYNYYVATADKRLYSLTDARTFKTALSVKMMESRINRRLTADINVGKCNYYKTPNDKHKQTTPFLYLSDIVCDVVRDGLNVSEADNGVEKACIHMEEVSGNTALTWIYDDMDSLWSETFSFFARKDYLRCLEHIFEIRNNKSLYVSHYDQQWVGKIEKEVEGFFLASKMDIYVSEIGYLLSTENKSREQQDYDILKGLFLGEKIIAVIKEQTMPVRKSLIYQLHDIMMKSYNHRGNIKKAAAEYGKCLELSNHVSPENYCETALNVAQLFANEFDFLGGIEAAELVKPQLEAMKDMYVRIAAEAGQGNEEVVTYPLLGRLKSTLGQLYAFRQEWDTAQQHFIEALAEFETLSSDRERTVSYLLHLAIDKKDKALYEQYAAEYLGNLDIGEQLAITMEDRYGYKAFVLIKALDVLYEKQPAKILEQVMKLCFDNINKTSIHPWEFIIRHACLLLYRHGKPIDSLAKALCGISHQYDGEFTLKVVTLFGEIILAQQCGYEKEKLAFKLGILKRYIEERNMASEHFVTVWKEKKQEKQIEMLKDKFTYMYS